MRMLFTMCLLAPLTLAGCKSDEGTCGERPDAKPNEGPIFPGPCEVFIDGDASGTTDGRIVYQYNDDDLEVRRFRYYGDTCRSAAVYELEYKDGVLVSESRDSEADGTVELKTSFVYDGDRLIAKVDIVPGRADTGDGGAASPCVAPPDGEGRRRNAAVNDYPDGGALPRRTVIDQECDGRPDSVVDFEYDAQGRLIKETFKADGREPSLVTTIEYDDRGRPMTRRTDDGATLTLKYSKVGNLIAQELDLDDDGTVDGRQVYDYRCWR